MTSVRSVNRNLRVEWLLANPDLWEGANAVKLDRDVRRSVVRLMKAAGLVAKSTYYLDVDIGRDIIEARRRRREAAS